MRLKHKKEEMGRIRALVDLAYNMDERVIKFKKEDKEKKMALRNARKNEIIQKKKEEEKVSTVIPTVLTPFRKLFSSTENIAY